MNRADAYAALCRELEAWRQLPHERLVGMVDQPAASKTVYLGQDPVTIGVRVVWADRKKQSIRIEATADGPSSWRLERLEEAIVIVVRSSARDGQTSG